MPIHAKVSAPQFKGKVYIFTPELKKRFAELGLDPIPRRPEEIPEAVQIRLRAEGFEWLATDVYLHLQKPSQ